MAFNLPKNSFVRVKNLVSEARKWEIITEVCDWCNYEQNFTA